MRGDSGEWGLRRVGAQVSGGIHRARALIPDTWRNTELLPLMRFEPTTTGSRPVLYS